MMKKMIPFVLFTGLLALVGCSNKNEFQPPPPPEVTVQAPVQKNVTVYKGFPGRLAASESIDIRARVKGYLKTVEFQSGDRVEAGQLLFTIEDEEYVAAEKSAKARLAQAEASRSLAEATYKRMAQASKTKAVSELDVDSAKAEQEYAEASVMEAKAALEQARLDLSYTLITAPIAGRVAMNTLSAGNLVGDGGSTLLTLLVAETPIDVFFNLDERALLPYLKDGVRLDTSHESIPPVKLELADGSTHTEEGIVNYVDPEIDPNTGTLRGRAVFKNEGLKLLPGLYGKIMIPDNREMAILVPDLAIQRDMTGAYVLVVTAENKVESRYIKRGPLLEDQRIIEEGLTAEDRVIVEGLQRARPGIKVHLSAPKSDEPSTAKAAE
jgi:RND family efflux transporter MFP subunit